jgi:hypothetical protein
LTTAAFNPGFDMRPELGALGVSIVVTCREKRVVLTDPISTPDKSLCRRSAYSRHAGEGYAVIRAFDL